MATMTVNGLQLYYEERGEGAAILGIHGTPSSCVLWRDAAVRLAGLGRCITYDRRGFGRSARPEPFVATDLADQVDDAVGLLDALGATPAVVVGRSTGGLIALEVARRAPRAVRALVLLEPALLSVDPAAQAWADDLRATVLAAGSPAAAARAAIRAALGDVGWETLPGGLAAVFTEGGDAVLAEARGTGLDLSADPLTLDDATLAGLEVPALLVSAEDSPEVLRRVTDHLAGRLPFATTLRVRGGHLIDPAHAGVLDFIGGLLAAPTTQPTDNHPPSP
jgi:pimeloyl-ACP methyl ester carboxylesterase